MIKESINRGGWTDIWSISVHDKTDDDQEVIDFVTDYVS